MTFRKSKPYVAILLGGYPSSAAKVMELIANPKRRLSFVYGHNIFVLYFHSRKPLSDISHVFLTAMRNEAEMIFVFPNSKKTLCYMADHVRVKIDKANSDRNKVIVTDINALRDVLTAIGLRLSAPMYDGSPVMPMNPEQQVEEQPTDDQKIMDKLLEKIRDEGYKALTPSELDFIKSYKEKYGKNSKNNNTDVD